MKHRLLTLILLIISFSFANNVLAQEGVAQFILDNPDNVSVVCIQGENVLVSHLPDETLTLASTSKTIILAEYARQVALGHLDPEEMIPLADVEQYWIPGTDGNAHEAWLASLGTDTDIVTLNQVVDGMMIFSTNAGPDYILSRLDRDGFVELYEILGMENTDVPTFFLGTVLVLSNHETGMTDIDYVASLDPETYLNEEQRLLDLFINDEDWRVAELTFRETETIGLPDVETQSVFFDSYSTQSTANDLVRLIQAPFTEDALPEIAQEIMQSHMDWLFDINPANADVYEDIATKSGAVAGLFTSVWYVDPIADDPITLVVLYHDLSDNMWIEWATTASYQSLEIATITTNSCDPFANLLTDG